MKMSVECGSKGNWNNIINTLTAMSEFKVTYIGPDKMKPIAMLFEVEHEDADHIIKTMKKAIKATDYGKSIMFRIVPYGQLVYFAS